jgi:hypothetical protein
MQGIADIGHLESVLLARRSELVQSTSFLFSTVALILVLGSFAWFLSAQYEMNAQKVEEKRIPFTPTVWYSATRNVRDEEYAGQLQPFEIETRYGVSRPGDGGSAAGIYATNDSYSAYGTAGGYGGAGGPDGGGTTEGPRES